MYTLRDKILRSKSTATGEMLGRGETQHSIIESTIPFPSASSPSLWSRETPTTWYLMAQRGHLGRVAWCTKHFFVFDFFSLLSVFYNAMYSHGSKFKRAHIVESLFPTPSKINYYSIVVKSMNLEPGFKF